MKLAIQIELLNRTGSEVRARLDRLQDSSRNTSAIKSFTGAATDTLIQALNGRVPTPAELDQMTDALAVRFIELTMCGDDFPSKGAIREGAAEIVRKSTGGA